MNRTEAEALLFSMTETEALRRHMRSVELVMRRLAQHFGEDEELYGITGLLHDADYEKWPEKHPALIVEELRRLGEDEMAHAIAGHYTKWNVPRNSLLDKCIVAADELTGFTYAAALIRPTKIDGMEPKSVIKKLKTKGFAASVDRDEVYQGAEMIGMELPDLIKMIIEVLMEHKEEMDLV